MSALSFIKMHGLGNDFVVFDARREALTLDAGAVCRIADRRIGVGCDQLIVIEPSAKTDAFMRIYNADGGEVGACGNATRCVAHLLMGESGADVATIETASGLLKARARHDGAVTVDMGPVRLDWQDIPLAEARDTLHMGIEAGALRDPVGVNVGNPHAVFFVDDAEAIALADLGPGLERHALFPERANIEAASIVAPDRIRLRVWERGAGITQACGTGACATLVAAARRGLTGRSATVILDGGALDIAWNDDNHVLMSGPVATSFTGTLDPSLVDERV